MSAEVVDRGPAERATRSPAPLDALRDGYGIRADADARDLGGSQNLNLLVTDIGDHECFAIRVYGRGSRLPGFRPCRWSVSVWRREESRVRCRSGPGTARRGFGLEIGLSKSSRTSPTTPG